MSLILDSSTAAISQPVTEVTSSLRTVTTADSAPTGAAGVDTIHASHITLGIRNFVAVTNVTFQTWLLIGNEWVKHSDGSFTTTDSLLVGPLSIRGADRVFLQVAAFTGTSLDVAYLVHNPVAPPVLETRPESIDLGNSSSAPVAAPANFQVFVPYDSAALGDAVENDVGLTVVAPPPPLILEVQQAAGFDHIYDFDYVGTPTSDKGSAPADFTVEGTWTLADASIQGTKGSYTNTTQISAANRLETATSAVNVARTSDIFFEGIWELPDPHPLGQSALASVGTYITAASNSGFGFLIWDGGVDNLQVWDPSFGVQIDATGLTDTYLLAPTYIAVWWDHTAGLYRLYYRKAGESETVLSSATHTVGIAGSQQLWISGNGVNIFTVDMKVHMFGIKRAALTPTHRNNIYESMGIL